MHRSRSSTAESTTTPSPTDTSTDWLNHEGIVNGIRLHWVQAQPPSKPTKSTTVSSTSSHPPLVILLHGFPECWYSWRHQLVALSHAGYRVVAPDLRGYNLSEQARSGYDICTLSNDVAQLIITLRRDENEKAFLVGHDWGGSIAWATAARFSHLVQKVAILNGPNLCMTDQHLSVRQRLRFWYIGVMFIPFLAEVLFCIRRGWLLQQMVQASCPSPHVFTPQTMAVYRDAWNRPGAFRCMLQYYRSSWTSHRQSRSFPPVKVPVLILWGERDCFLGRELVDSRLERYYVDAPCERVFLDCGHWIQQEQSNQVNRHLIRFFVKEKDSNE